VVCQPGTTDVVFPHENADKSLIRKIMKNKKEYLIISDPVAANGQSVCVVATVENLQSRLALLLKNGCPQI
jgi:hypothetical protein